MKCVAGVVNAEDAFERLNRQTWDIMIIDRVLHPVSSIERLFAARSRGRMGLQSVLVTTRTKESNFNGTLSSDKQCMSNKKDETKLSHQSN